MRITLVGPGRAGLALALAARGAGHHVVAVAARRHAAAAAAIDLVGTGRALRVGDSLPSSDPVVVAARDDVIGEVARLIAPTAPREAAAVHLSGLIGLDPLASRVLETGSFHSLQTLPDPEMGARLLTGAWIAVTTPHPALATQLYDLATSIGGTPFDLTEESRAIYHAAAAAASNFPAAVFAMAGDLFDAAGVPFMAARRLTEATVANAFSLGPRAALAGPVMRGDRATVEAQMRTISERSPQWQEAFAALTAILADLAGRGSEFADLGGEPSA